MNNELERMQQLASSFSSVRLRRLGCLPERDFDDGLLLSGIILILLLDNADKTLIFMLLYMFLP